MLGQMYGLGQTGETIPLDPELKWTYEQEAMFKTARLKAMEEGKPVYSGETYGGKRIYVDAAGNKFTFISDAAETTADVVKPTGFLVYVLIAAAGYLGLKALKIL